MSACKLICDNREHAVLRHDIEFAGITKSVMQMTTGDYAILNPTGNILVIIERKSFDDFGASLIDGRHNNKEKLLKLRAGTNCKIIFIIEGEAFPDPNNQYARIPYKYIESAIFHMMVRDNISIIRTKDTLDTAKTLVRFIHSMDTLIAQKDYYDGSGKVNLTTNDIAAAPDEVPIVNNEYINLLTAVHVKSDHDIVREMWARFRGISVQNADDLINVCSIKELVDGLNPYSVKTSSGKPLNKSILKSLSHIDVAIETKILASIPGISAAAASDIIISARLNRLLTYPVEAISIIKIGKGKRNLGIAKAEKIIKYCNYTTKQVAAT